MNVKECSTCKLILPLECFGICNRKKDGRRNKCKKCINKYNKERSPHWNCRTREARRAEHKRLGRYGDLTRKSRNERYRKNNKEKRRIRDKTYRANKEQKKCSIAGCDKNAERHHTDYNAPEHFVWLCKEHHIEAHLNAKA